MTKMEEENAQFPELFEIAYEQYLNTIPTLEKKKGWFTEHLMQYKDMWLTPRALKGIMLSQSLFKPKPNDIYLATFPKCGTTWFKALIFCIINRKIHPPSDKSHPLLHSNPHDIVPFIEQLSYDKNTITIEHLSSPRILATHCNYTLFSEILGRNFTTNPRMKLVYVARNPKDALVSMWEFSRRLRVQSNLYPLSLEEAYDMFCQGVTHFGSYWDHVLDYYEASLMHPNNVMFLTYENMKDDPSFWVRKMADFLGQEFDKQEDDQELVEKICALCSFDSLSKCETNKSGIKIFSNNFVVPNSIFFREGSVGDWRRYLTTEMAENLDEISKSKFENSGLSIFKANLSLI